MTRASSLLGATGLVVLAALGATPAFAQTTTPTMTRAGVEIVNTAEVNFTVGGVEQTKVFSNEDRFTVDRKVNVVVTKLADATVNPRQQNAATKFSVSNQSNASLDFALSVVQPTTDKFDITAPKIYLDDGDGLFDATKDTQVTFLNSVARESAVTVWVVGNIPDQANTDTAVVQLFAEARTDDGSAATVGAAMTQSATNAKNAEDIVFADGSSGLAGDAARDAKHAAAATYTVAGALLTAVKTSTVISDPVNLTSSPKAIPGATVQYCIAVSNASGGATALAVTVGDIIPANTTYDAVYGVKVGGTKTSGICNAGAIVGTYDPAANKVTGIIPTLLGNATTTLMFQVTVN